MKTVYRQDGSAVELSDDDAAQWLRLGLATERPATPAKSAPTRAKEPTTDNEGVQA